MDTSGTPPQYVIVDRLGAFFYWTRFIWQYRVAQKTVSCCTVSTAYFFLSHPVVYHSIIPLRFIWSICSAN